MAARESYLNFQRSVSEGYVPKKTSIGYAPEKKQSMVVLIIVVIITLLIVALVIFLIARRESLNSKSTEENQ